MSQGIIRAVCISEKKGQQKHPVDSVHLRPEHGIDGDAHAGNWHRQVSLLGQESVDRLQEKISIRLFPAPLPRTSCARASIFTGSRLGQGCGSAQRCARSHRSARSATRTAPSGSRPATVSCLERASS